MNILKPYLAANNRYETMLYNRSGRSGLKLSAISLGLWHNFGENSNLDNARALLRTAFDNGITHFDLANNYGPPYGSAEESFGKLYQQDFKPYRDELILSSKAGYDMWMGPYGNWGSRKYLLASLDQSLKRMKVDYVDIFYHHRPDPETPLEETMGALASAVQQGKALYAGISNYKPKQAKEAAQLLKSMGVPCLIHQPSYSMLNRWIETEGLLDVLEDEGVGCIVFSPLAQGLLTEKYLNGIPENSRMKSSHFLKADALTPERLAQLHKLNDIAKARNQNLAQLALSWCLRDKRVTSVLIGASSSEQIIENVACLEQSTVNKTELEQIEDVLKQK
jgi:L-glyceraldehyde 3-phosphate reductase